MKARPVALAICISLILLAGCTSLSRWTTGNGIPGENASGNQSAYIPGLINQSVNGTAAANASIPPGNAGANLAVREYANARSFFLFTDPNEGAFSLEVPQGWAVTNGSGLVRPYIDAGVAFEAKSPSGQGFTFQDPYSYIYATPNQLLDFAGFTEGSLYNPSGGIAQPMMVRAYVSAAGFASELIAKSGLNATNVKSVDRPDLANASSPLITRQSASETSFDYLSGGKGMSAVLVIRTTLVEGSGTGVWYVTGMEYYSPTALMNETGLLALDMQRSFKVDPAWAARENKEVQKRLGILAQGQSDVAATISSVFETRSKTMDDLNDKWDKQILGIEDVYDPATGDHYVVDGGSKYYWIDNRGNIYGTQIDESPFPNQNLEKMNCPDC